MGGCSFYIKNILKSEIPNGKKFLNNFSVITKNLNWEMLTKKLVIKDGVGLRIKKRREVFLRGTDTPLHTMYVKSS